MVEYLLFSRFQRSVIQSQMGSLFRHLCVFLTIGLGLASGACAQGESVPVSVARVMRTDVHNELPLSGTVSPWRSVYLSSRIEGFISRLLVAEGDEVAAGEAVLELDSTMAQIELDRVGAQLQEARVRYGEAVRQRDEVMQLVEKKHVAGTTAASAESDVALFAAGVQRLRAKRRREQVLLAWHVVVAPFAGVVSEKLVEVGSWVETSTDLVRLVETQRLRVEVPVPQNHFAAVTRNTPVLVQFDALPEFSYSGLVTTVIPVSDNAARTFPVHIEIDNSERVVAPGMSARVRLRLNHTADALVLPKDAVLRDAHGNESVWVIHEEDGVASGTRVDVETGRTLRDWIEVKPGAVEVGDRVVVHGNEGLRAGQTVRITEEIRPSS